MNIYNLNINLFRKWNRASPLVLYTAPRTKALITSQSQAMTTSRCQPITISKYLLMAISKCPIMAINKCQPMTKCLCPLITSNNLLITTTCLQPRIRTPSSSKSYKSNFWSKKLRWRKWRMLLLLTRTKAMVAVWIPTSLPCLHYRLLQFPLATRINPWS